MNISNIVDLVFGMDEIRSLTFTKLESLECEHFAKGTTSENIDTSGNIRYVAESLRFLKMYSHPTKRKRNVFILPPAEGMLDLLQKIASSLDANVYGAEYPLLEFTSIPDLLELYYNELTKTQTEGPYKFIGYSFGCFMACELGARLENAGHKVELILIDGSPDFVIGLQKAILSRKTEHNDAQIKLIVHYLRQFDQSNIKQTTAELLQLKTWDERVTKAAETAAPFMKRFKTRAEIKRHFNMMYGCVQATVSYTPESVFTGDIMLIKASSVLVDIDETYGLKQRCSGRITVKTVDGTHRTIVDDPLTVSCINEYFKFN